VRDAIPRGDDPTINSMMVMGLVSLREWNRPILQGAAPAKQPFVYQIVAPVHDRFCHGLWGVRRGGLA